MLTAWAANPSDTINPFEPTQKGNVTYSSHIQPFELELMCWSAPSFNAVRIRLAQEEARDLLNSGDAPVSETVSASQLIALGIEIENNQCVSIMSVTFVAPADSLRKAKI